MAAVAAAATETKTSAVAVPGFHVPFRCPLNPAEWTFVELQVRQLESVGLRGL